MADDPVTPPDQIEPVPHPPITLAITYHDGRVTVNGPLDDEIFCYGLLQMAVNQVRAYKDKQRAMLAAKSDPRVPQRTPGGLLIP